MLSIPHMIVLFVVVLVVFGPQKLPELARGLGKLMAEFRKASTDFRSAFEEEMREMERNTLQAERKKAAEAVAAGAVEPAQPATLATQSGAETLSPDSQTDTRATEAIVVSPIAESVPHVSEEPSESKSETTAVSDSHDLPHDTQQPA
jgi:sec-independent protein translocase protein TatB